MARGRIRWCPAPFPSGFSLGATGVISGTPLAVGRPGIPGTFSDSAGNSITAAIPLVITNPGTPTPLLPVSSNIIGAEAPVEPSVGTPYVIVLDQFVSGGVQPLTWTVTNGALPSGLAMLPGGNGVPAHIAGIPTMAGEFPFDIQVTDAAGQTVAFEGGGLEVTAIGFSATSVPPMMVGTPVSLALGPYRRNAAGTRFRSILCSTFRTASR